MDERNYAWTTTFLEEWRGNRNFYPVFFISLQSPMKKISRHFLIFIQPLNDKRLKPAAERRKGVYFKHRKWCYTLFCQVCCRASVGELLLTQDILALCSWKKVSLCSTHCTATWPWSVGSCNPHSCTNDFFHVLIKSCREIHDGQQWNFTGLHIKHTEVQAKHTSGFAKYN